MGRIRIISDGTGCGTSITDADTGAEIEFVTRVEWSCESGEPATALLTVELVQLDVVGDGLIPERGEVQLT